MSPRCSALVLSLMALPAALPLHADERRDAIRAIHASWKEALVVVSFQLRAGDDPGSASQSHRVPGVLVDDKGLVMVSALGFPEQVPLQRYQQLRVITASGPEDQGYPARILGRGASPYVAFLRVEDPSKLPKLPVLRFEEGDVGLGDDLMILFPTDQRDRVSFLLGLCNLELETPVRGWALTATASAGCPVFSLNGKAVGVVAGRRSGNQVHTFVLSARDLLPSIAKPPEPPKQNRTAARPRGWTGLVSIQPILSRDLAEDFGLPAQSGGIVIGTLVGESPAGKAGLRVGDVILRFKGVEMRRRQGVDAEFLEMLNRLGEEEDIPMEIWREGSALQVTLHTVPLPKVAAQARRAVLPAWGCVVREMVLDDRWGMNLPPDAAGAVVDSVTSAAPAADAGVRPLDVVKRVNDRDVDGLDAFQDAVGRLEAERPAVAYLTVLRAGRDTLVLRLRPRWDRR